MKIKQRFSPATGRDNDVSIIGGMLTGEWQLCLLFCFWGGDFYNPIEDVRVQFTGEGEYIITVGSLTEHGQWEVTESIQKSFRLQHTPRNHYFHGNIFVCDDLLLFHNSGVDGCDHYFARIL